MIGNLNEEGYLIASDEELLGIAPAAPPEVDAAKSENVVKEAAALGLAALADDPAEQSEPDVNTWNAPTDPDALLQSSMHSPNGSAAAATAPAVELNSTVPPSKNGSRPVPKVNFNHEDLKEAIDIVRQLDPPGVASLADLLHSLSNDVADGGVVIGRNRPNLPNHVAGDGFGKFV